MCGKVQVPHIGRRLQSELKTDVRVSCLRGPMWPCISQMCCTPPICVVVYMCVCMSQVGGKRERESERERERNTETAPWQLAGNAPCQRHTNPLATQQEHVRNTDLEHTVWKRQEHTLGTHVRYTLGTRQEHTPARGTRQRAARAPVCVCVCVYTHIPRAQSTASSICGIKYLNNTRQPYAGGQRDLYMCVNVCVCVCIDIYLCKYECACMYVNICVYVYGYICM